MTAKLSAKQLKFVKEYQKDLNATQAAIRAGYSKKTAAVIGAENLIKPNIQAALKKATEAAEKRDKVLRPEMALEMLTRIATRSPRGLKALSPEMQGLPDEELDQMDIQWEIGGKIDMEDPAGMKFTPRLRMKLFDPVKALAAIMRHHDAKAARIIKAKELKLKIAEFELRKKELEARQREAGNDAKDTEARVWDVPPLKRPT